MEKNVVGHALLEVGAASTGMDMVKNEGVGNGLISLQKINLSGFLYDSR